MDYLKFLYKNPLEMKNSFEEARKENELSPDIKPLPPVQPQCLGLPP